MENKTGFAGLQEIWNYSRTNNTLYIPVCGNCMELENINDGDYVEIDLSKKPRLPQYGTDDGIPKFDSCLCYCEPVPGQSPIMMIKAYIGIMLGRQVVGTRYAPSATEPKINHTLFPLAVLGVVKACYDSDMNLKWERDLSKCPDALQNEDTVKCFGFDRVLNTV